MKTQVSIVKAPTYAHTESAIRHAVELLGGIDEFLRPGMKVLLKPNLLFGASPDKCITTHPEVVKAVVNIVRQAGCIPIMGDSPAVGSGRMHYRWSGFAEICREMNVEWVDFEDDAVEVAGKHLFKKLEIAKAVLAADAIINLPKVKTHGQTYLTLAVKNMFGIIPGVRKSRWHMNAGSDAVLFSKMLLEICYYKKPVLNIVDGIIAMEGNGPRSGDPYPLGYIIAGEDPSAVDRVIVHMLNTKPSKVPTLIAAEQMGLGETNLDNIQIWGDEPAEADVKRFRFCGQHLPSDMMGLGTFVPLFKDAVTSRPVVNHNLCSRCEECIEHCPASAMEMSPDGKNRVERVNIDLKTCIGCFCCSEICPEGAISVKQGWIWRLLPGFLK